MDGYPDDWVTRSQEVKNRDSYTCQNCGAKGGAKGENELHAHHIVPISDGGSHKKSNLKTLCKDCHNAIHHNDKVAPTGQLSRSTNQYDTAGENKVTNSNVDVYIKGATLLGRVLLWTIGGTMVITGLGITIGWPALLVGTDWTAILLGLPIFLGFALVYGTVVCYIGLLVWNIGCLGKYRDQKLNRSISKYPARFYWRIFKRLAFQLQKYRKQ